MGHSIENIVIADDQSLKQKILDFFEFEDFPEDFSVLLQNLDKTSTSKKLSPKETLKNIIQLLTHVCTRSITKDIIFSNLLLFRQEFHTI
jgi:hypothetical protein